MNNCEMCQMRALLSGIPEEVKPPAEHPGASEASLPHSSFGGLASQGEDAGRYSNTLASFVDSIPTAGPLTTEESARMRLLFDLEIRPLIALNYIHYLSGRPE